MGNLLFKDKGSASCENGASTIFSNNWRSFLFWKRSFQTLFILKCLFNDHFTSYMSLLNCLSFRLASHFELCFLSPRFTPLNVSLLLKYICLHSFLVGINKILFTSGILASSKLLTLKKCSVQTNEGGAIDEVRRKKRCLARKRL